MIRAVRYTYVVNPLRWSTLGEFASNFISPICVVHTYRITYMDAASSVPDVDIKHFSIRIYIFSRRIHLFFLNLQIFLLNISISSNGKEEQRPGCWRAFRNTNCSCAVIDTSFYPQAEGLEATPTLDVSPHYLSQQVCVFLSLP